MYEDFAPANSSFEPSMLFVLLAWLVVALALKVLLTSAREGERARGGRASSTALWPGLLAWGLGLWSAGLLAVAGLEPVSDLRFSLSDAGWLLAAALLSGLPPLLLLARQHDNPRSTRRLGGAALLLALPAIAMPMGWLQAARLDPAPLWQLSWVALGAVVATAGLGAALALAYSALSEGHPMRRLWRTAAAVCGGVALLLGQVLVHEGALVSKEVFSGAAATLPVAVTSGVGALTPLLLVGLMVLQRLRRYASEDERHRGSQYRRNPRRRRTRPWPGGGHSAAPSTVGPSLTEAGPAAEPLAAAQARRQKKYRRNRLL